MLKSTSKNTVKTEKINQPTEDFAESSISELNGLIKNGTIIPTQRTEILEVTRVFESIFIDGIKQSVQCVRLKSRPFAQNYADEEETNTATKSLTVHRFSQRILVSLAASIGGMVKFTHITQTFENPSTLLQINVFISAPREMILPSNTVL